MSRFECGIPATTYALNAKEKPELANAVLTQLGYYWMKLDEQGVWKYINLDSNEYTNADFIKYVFDKSGTFILITDKEKMYEPAGHLRISQASGFVSNAHFGINREFSKYGTVIMQEAVDFVFQHKFATSLIGIIPTFNKPVIKLAKTLGFEQVQIVPEAFYVYRKSRFYDGKMFVLNKNGR